MTSRALPTTRCGTAGRCPATRPSTICCWPRRLERLLPRRDAELQIARHRREGRAHEHADLGGIPQLRLTREGERPDEEAHGEADAAQERHAVALGPRR